VIEIYHINSSDLQCSVVQNQNLQHFVLFCLCYWYRKSERTKSFVHAQISILKKIRDDNKFLCPSSLSWNINIWHVTLCNVRCVAHIVYGFYSFEISGQSSLIKFWLLNIKAQKKNLHTFWRFENALLIILKSDCQVPVKI
jgi:hypothetical protein